MPYNNELLQKIADPNVNVAEFVQLISDDEPLRAEIVSQMLSNKAIMVYYHCYYIVDQASAIQPQLFYRYWNDFAALLHHPNSYHRDIGLTIIANLSAVDTEQRFPGILDEYLSHINDPKFMTALCMVRNTKKIIRYQPNIQKLIIDFLSSANKRCSYPDKQKALLNADIIEVFDEVYEMTPDKKPIETFVRNEINSISPKTRGKAKEFMKKYATGDG
jgi:hypothetical protein